MNNALRSLAPDFRHAHINGWGADLDHENRPGYPKELNQENVLSPVHHLPIAVKQKPGPDVNLTLERGEYTPVIGNSVSPSFLTRPLRKFAFTFSEDSLRHWMLLLLADRLNMVEGWIEDIGRGKMPMIFPRMEFRTTDHIRRIMMQGPKSKQDKALVATGVVIAAAGIGALAYFLLRNKSN